MKNPHSGKWEKRWHPLREEWVVYSAHRNQRPWQGASPLSVKTLPEYDPACYLCPGNKRVHGAINPLYTAVFIFENDHPVMSMHAPEVENQQPDSINKKGTARGIAKVVCYDSRHNMTLSQMPLKKVVRVFEAFQQEMIQFEKDPVIESVLIFENKGEAVGVSNPHPHCQIYAADFHFKLVDEQNARANSYRLKFNRNLFDEIISLEVRDQVRIIAENEAAIAFIPFFARYAYEVMIFPKSHHQTLLSLTPGELEGFVRIFHEVIRKFDMNFEMDFPYVMSVMQAPVDGKQYEEFRMHVWLQPPYRQPGLIKYLAGPEIGAGNFMADTIPEEKAAELRRLNVNNYRHERD